MFLLAEGSDVSEIDQILQISRFIELKLAVQKQNKNVTFIKKRINW